MLIKLYCYIGIKCIKNSNWTLVYSERVLMLVIHEVASHKMP